jgi:hypothetical protein
VPSGQSGGVQAWARAVVALTVAEVRRLLRKLILQRFPSPADVLAWSAWRRHHQAVARRGHDQTRGTIPHELQL